MSFIRVKKKERENKKSDNLSTGQGVGVKHQTLLFRF